MALNHEVGIVAVVGDEEPHKMELVHYEAGVERRGKKSVVDIEVGFVNPGCSIDQGPAVAVHFVEDILKLHNHVVPDLDDHTGKAAGVVT